MDKDKPESELLSCWESLKKEIFGVCDRLSAAEAKNERLRKKNKEWKKTLLLLDKMRHIQENQYTKRIVEQALKD